MRRSTDRILTTQIGSLPRPASLLDLMKTGEQGHELASAVTRAVDAAVREQIAHGVDVVTDGEQGKASFFTYVAERLTGFEPRPGARAELWSAEVRAFPEYYAEYFRRAMTGGSVVTLDPLVCVGPITYRGQAAIARDIANLTAALERQPHREAFLPAVAPSGLGFMAGSSQAANEHYPAEAPIAESACAGRHLLAGGQRCKPGDIAALLRRQPRSHVRPHNGAGRHCEAACWTYWMDGTGQLLCDAAAQS